MIAFLRVDRRNAARVLAGGLLSIVLLTAGPPPSGAQAVAPMFDPLFLRPRQVGVLCLVEPERSAVLDADTLCERALTVLRARLRPERRDRVVRLSFNDERLVDPAVLTVTLHARIATPLSGGPAGSVVALAAGLLRNGMPPGHQILFPAAPQVAFTGPDGRAMLDAPLAALLGDIASALDGGPPWP